ncbi:hypothetical protein GGR42_002580 [Saonia flava]|uniref:Uncharacterized protein n=1 Tax=Saonia flava TaxID=523696 RepID=A0A846R5N4_9FLAO|nr:hypothetical protein [Saonia flava]
MVIYSLHNYIAMDMDLYIFTAWFFIMLMLVSKLFMGVRAFQKEMKNLKK